jgi:hypothetical protein
MIDMATRLKPLLHCVESSKHASRQHLLVQSDQLAIAHQLQEK